MKIVFDLLQFLSVYFHSYFFHTFYLSTQFHQHFMHSKNSFGTWNFFICLSGVFHKVWSYIIPTYVDWYWHTFVGELCQTLCIFYWHFTPKNIWDRFKQRFMSSFYACSSQKRKKTWLFFALLGSLGIKAVSEYVVEIDTLSL